MVRRAAYTAKLSALDPEDYPRQVLERIADHPVKQVQGGVSDPAQP
jgi:hypothetical protein